MSSGIRAAFELAGAEGRAAFIPFVTGGFPDMQGFAAILQALDSSGADLIEVGLPFSDPIADGPAIQLSSALALEKGATAESVMDVVRGVSPGLRAGLVVMTYTNPVLAMGMTRFAATARQAGFLGAIVPDLPPEEASPWLAAAGSEGLDTIFMATPTTSADRLGRVLSVCSGYLYYVCLTGVTGAALPSVSSSLGDRISWIRRQSALPVAAGFGISTPVEAAAVGRVADGVIVGSRLVRVITEACRQSADVTGAVSKLCGTMVAAILGARPRDRQHGPVAARKEVRA